MCYIVIYRSPTLIRAQTAVPQRVFTARDRHILVVRAPIEVWSIEWTRLPTTHNHKARTGGIINSFRAPSCPSWLTSPSSLLHQLPTANCQPLTANCQLLLPFSPLRLFAFGPYLVDCHSHEAMLLANSIVPAWVHAANQR